MKHIFYICLISLSSLTTVWADCTLPGGRTLPESQAVSLLDEGKSLSQFRIQDQDGLGTCYANATSAVLQSVLPNNPEISYGHAAIQTTVLGWRADPRDSNYTILNSENPAVVNGGYFCETVTALKRSGGACPKSLSVLENTEQLDPAIQQRFYNDLGRYFDILRVSSTPEALSELRTDLGKVIDSMKYYRAEQRERCEELSSSPFPITYPVSELLSDLALSLNDGSTCGAERLDLLKPYLGPNSDVRSDRVGRVTPAPSVVSGIRAMIEGDEEIKRLLKDYPILTPSQTNRFNNLMGGKLKPYLLSLIQSESLSDSCKSTPHDWLSSEVDLGFMIPDGISAQEDYCKNFPVDPTFKTETELSCIAPVRLETLMKAIKPLTEIGRALDEQLLNDLTTPESPNEHKLRALLMPQCENPANLVAMNNVSCATFSTCSSGLNASMENLTYDGPPGGCYEFSQAKNMARERIFNNIRNGRAVGLSVCTNFMTTPGVRTNFCKGGAGGGVKGHAFHAMTVSGYRCQNGELEYQVLNSWGKHCPAGDKTGFKNSDLECELGADGRPSGRFWLKEDVMVDSAVGFTQILNGGSR